MRRREVCRSRRRRSSALLRTITAACSCTRKIDPVALQLGPLAIHWYGLTYLAAFGLFMFLATRRLRHEPFASVQGPGAWSRKDVEDMLFLGVLGVVVGGRLGYCLFYKPAYYLDASAGDLLRLAGRHELPWRHARRASRRSGGSRARAASRSGR